MQFSRKMVPNVLWNCHENRFVLFGVSIRSLFDFVFFLLWFFFSFAACFSSTSSESFFLFLYCSVLTVAFFIFILIVGSCEMFRYAGNHVDRIIVCWCSGCSTFLLSNRINYDSMNHIRRKKYISNIVLSLI